MKVWRGGELVTLIARKELLALDRKVAGAVLTGVKDRQRWKVNCRCNHGRGAVVINKLYRRRHLRIKHGIVGEEADSILGVKRAVKQVGRSVDLSRRARLSWIKIWLKRGRKDKAEALARELGVKMDAA